MNKGEAVFRARWATVEAVLERRGDRQRLAVRLEGEEAAAINYVPLTGEAVRGDRVLLNTTAVALGLGSGGHHFVMAIEGRLPPDPAGCGHIMKLRYTPWQFPVRAVEEDLADAPLDLGGMPVVVGELHSQVAPAVLGAHAAAERPLRVAYVMTDGGALPLALSDQVDGLKAAGLVAATVTAGHAFGGDREAVTVPGALLAARWLLGADVAVVAMGPGSVGTGTALGFSGLEQAWILDAVAALGGTPVAAVRLGFADPRPRHRGLSHHARTNLGRIVRSRVLVPLPHLPPEQEEVVRCQLLASGIAARHDVRRLAPPPLAAALSGSPVPLRSMGRAWTDDPSFFLAAAAAGWAAAGFAADASSFLPYVRAVGRIRLASSGTNSTLT